MRNRKRMPGGSDARVFLEDLLPGAHLVAPRRGFAHHGIYVGDGRVIHYAGYRASIRSRAVEEVSIADFADGRPVAVRQDVVVRFAPPTVVERARSRLGEDCYRLASNNCEHFCFWCLRDEHRSAQVERMLAAPLGLLLALRETVFGAWRRNGWRLKSLRSPA